MDPNATLDEIRTLLDRPDWPYSLPPEFSRLQELVEELDGWLSAGGFLPAAWSDCR